MEEYLKDEIIKLLNESKDCDLLDLILRILRKSNQQISYCD